MAARRNFVVPAGLDSYRASAESELAALFRRPDGTEGATQIEQMASVLQWRRPGAFTQHIIGYQAQLSGPNISALGFFKQSWIVPVLYGNRLGLFLGRDTAHTGRRAVTRNPNVVVVHPFARDRDSVYRFSGGDTALTIHVEGRSIPIALVHVRVLPHLRRHTVVFEGDIYVDAERGEIVRMRGIFEEVGGRASLGSEIEDAMLQGQVFIDLTNREVDGRYWLPNSQRIEAEFTTPVMGEARSVFRIITRFGSYTINDTTGVAANGAPAAVAAIPLDSLAIDTLSNDTLRILPHRLTIAPADSLAHFSGWRAPIGEATAAVRVDDFNDVASDAWRDTGPPRLALGARNGSDFFRFDRIEGVYTGVGLILSYRDAAPGLTSRANVGWAWAEHTARGGLSTEWRNGPWLLGASVARTLDNTNDFRGLFTSGPFLEALVSEDDYDYVDRRTANLSVRHDWRGALAGHGISLILTGGIGDDHGDESRLTRGLLPPVLFADSIFRPNRNVQEGTYLLSGLTLAINPAIDAGFVGEGVGARLHYEIAGDGQLAWQRAEARAVVREIFGPFTTLARVDGGIVTGSVIPPQQMFEIGLVEGLLAYDYKQFGGDRAAIWRAEEMYGLPFWRRPLRILGFVLPGPAPSVSLGFQSGWTETATEAGRLALTELGARVNPATNQVLRDSAGVPIPVSSPTNGIRTSINFLVRFFGGALGVGAAHSLDPGARWQSVVVIGTAL